MQHQAETKAWSSWGVAGASPHGEEEKLQATVMAAAKVTCPDSMELVKKAASPSSRSTRAAAPQDGTILSGSSPPFAGLHASHL